MISPGVTSQTFGSFPDFSRLTLADKEAYDALIREYPPIYDISFTALMTWWNPLDNMAIARLNGNVVVPYWFGGDDKHAGLSLIGTNKVDESMCEIFDYLRAEGRPVRLVNVPEFVVTNVQFHELFSFKEERQYSEYIYPISRFYPAKNMPLYWRKKVERRQKDIESGKMVVRSLDLNSETDSLLLLRAVNEWQSKGINDYGKVEQDTIRECIINAAPLEIDNMCLFVDGKLHGFCLYEVPSDKRYITVKHVKATHDTTLGFELIGYMFAKRLSEQGTTHVNLNADFGKLGLRMFMLALGPSNFFRKYIVEPR
jgi:hypothetical protein